MFTLSNFHTKFNYIKKNYDFNRLTFHCLNLTSLQI